jgi:hypothetical protein
MISSWWSWALCVLGSAGLLVVGRKYWWGWLVLLANEILWVVYGWKTSQYGFIVAAMIYGAVYIHNMSHWKRSHV